MIRSVLFDLDGTLLDSAPDLVGALNWLRAAHDLPPLDVGEMSRHVSHGVVGLLEAGMPPVDDDTFESWRLEFLERYAANSFVASRLYDGVTELIAYLNRCGVPWGIVTNKREALTLPILQAAGIRDAVACVVCGDTLNRSKPDPAPVRLACEIIAADPRETLFVGDHVKDLQAGRAAGTLTGAAHYGYGFGELEGPLVRESYPVHRPTDLIDLFQRQPAAP